MDPLPAFEELEARAGEDSASKWPIYLDDIYGIYLETIANGGLTFRGLPVSCQFRPMTDGKGFGFWHIMQEGKVEENRTPDLERCRRIRWIAWTVLAAQAGDDQVAVFPQQKRWGEQPWALWVRAQNYLVILVERGNYFLLRTAFVANRAGKRAELERDRKAHYGGP